MVIHKAYLKVLDSRIKNNDIEMNDFRSVNGSEPSGKGLNIKRKEEGGDGE